MEAVFIVIVIAALAWIKAFRYMAMALLLGVGAYQAGEYAGFSMQPHVIIFLAAGTLLVTLVLQMFAEKGKKE